tara:strand:+ start:978 stop:1205 length:228 start_codon:yes stop_codon:yes gene_type:complete
MEDYEDEELRLDKEYTESIINETNEQNKQDDYDKKCVFIFSDIQSYLDKEGLTYELFYSLSIDKIKELLSLLTSF